MERSITQCDINPANVFVVDKSDPGEPTATLGDIDVSHTASGLTATLMLLDAARRREVWPRRRWREQQSGQPPRATSKLDVYGLNCVIHHTHMYLRTLPESAGLATWRAGLA